MFQGTVWAAVSLPPPVAGRVQACGCLLAAGPERRNLIFAERGSVGYHSSLSDTYGLGLFVFFG